MWHKIAQIGDMKMPIFCAKNIFLRIWRQLQLVARNLAG